MNMQMLRDELSSDPLGRGYQSMSDAEVAESLNAATRNVFVPISGNALLKWSALGASTADSRPSRNVRLDLAAKRQEPYGALALEVQGLAAAAVTAIQSLTGLSYDQPDIREMVIVLQQAGVLTAAETGDLDALGTAAVSRAWELGLGVVKAGHVEQVRTG